MREPLRRVAFLSACALIWLVSGAAQCLQPGNDDDDDDSTFVGMPLAEFASKMCERAVDCEPTHGKMFASQSECQSMLTAMFVQVTQGYFHFEFGVYLQDLFGVKLLDFCLLSVLVMLVHVVVNHKYLGHFVMVLYYLATAFMGRFGLEHHLYDYASHPSYTYSDMNGFGHFLAPIRWFNLHWAAWAVLLAVAANLLWVRGLEVRPVRRRVALSAAARRSWSSAEVASRTGRPPRPGTIALGRSSCQSYGRSRPRRARRPTRPGC